MSRKRACAGAPCSIDTISGLGVGLDEPSPLRGGFSAWWHMLCPRVLIFVQRMKGQGSASGVRQHFSALGAPRHESSLERVIDPIQTPPVDDFSSFPSEGG